MISAMISGRLIEPAAEKFGSKNGTRFVSAKIMADMRGSQYGQWVNVVAFGDAACAALLACAPDEAVSVAGEMQIGTYTGNDGKTRASVNVVANAVLTMSMGRHVHQPRTAGPRAPQTGNGHAPTPADDPDDQVPY